MPIFNGKSNIGEVKFGGKSDLIWVNNVAFVLSITPKEALTRFQHQVVTVNLYDDLKIPNDVEIVAVQWSKNTSPIYYYKTSKYISNNFIINKDTQEFEITIWYMDIFTYGGVDIDLDDTNLNVSKIVYHAKEVLKDG